MRRSPRRAQEIDSLYERAVELRFGAVAWLPVDRDCDHLRSDPRFQAMIRKLDFPD